MKKVILLIVLILIILSTILIAFAGVQQDLFISPSGGDSGGRAILDSIFFVI